jgi:hypothetical protein
MKNLSTNIYCLNLKCRLQLFSDGGLIWSPLYCQVYQFNIMACFILKYTNGRNSINSISTTLAKEFDISGTQAKLDIIKLYRYWLEQGIIDFVRVQ